MADFYARLYWAVPNVDELQRRMIEKQEEFTRSAAVAVMREHLGC